MGIGDSAGMFQPYSSVLPGITDTGVPRFVVADIICPSVDKAQPIPDRPESCDIVDATTHGILFVVPCACFLPGK
ncbi:MAG: hypothetical protein ACE5EU_06135 [Paracoccaceae bacterium]